MERITRHSMRFIFIVLEYSSQKPQVLRGSDLIFKFSLLHFNIQLIKMPYFVYIFLDSSV